MKIDPIPVWQFFEIPENAIEICNQLAKSTKEQVEDGLYWQRAANFLSSVKLNTVDQLPERDFDWMLKLRVQFEHEQENTSKARLKSKIRKSRQSKN